MVSGMLFISPANPLAEPFSDLWTVTGAHTRREGFSFTLTSQTRSAGAAGKITMPFPRDILQDIERWVAFPARLVRLCSLQGRSTLATLNALTCLRLPRRDYAQAGKIQKLSSDVSSSPSRGAGATGWKGIL